MLTRVVFYVVLAGVVIQWLNEVTRRTIAEIPCTISRAVVILDPGGIFVLDEAGVDKNSVTVLSGVDFEVVPVGWREMRCRAVLVAGR